ncbi:iron ABC transporter permease [Roseofilum sp. BLCC_M143]|uniref:Iron ABC transporter permease n=1 Tax=Roseofilum casamattae BLCC-M143 TaxID=3022442 RepID=A0ABT7C1K9_9CYAN|nr:iron ABC transporter permease [Roseofilum casamattae BLCC-M143]
MERPSFFRQWLPKGWTIATTAIALPIATPILCVLAKSFTDTGDIWQHLVETVLLRYLLNSFALIAGVGSGVLLLGVGCAWLVTTCNFWGRRWFEWALLLPLASPAYVLAYTYTEWLEYYGPVQTSLRNWFGWQDVSDYWFPSVRSLPSAIILFSLVLYPYVYLLTRVAFLEQASRTLEASRSLGCNPWQSFGKVALPLARPAIIAGLSLVLMETLSDFGTVEYFGVDTFTTGIYRVWFGMGEPAAAAQLSSFLLLFILVFIVLEQWSRRQAKYYQSGDRFSPIQPYMLQGVRGSLATLSCLIPLMFGFVLPAGLLVKMAIDNPDSWQGRFWEYAQHSFTLAAIAALLGIIFSVTIAYGVRLYPNLIMQITARISAIGYAIPGSVIAVGILIPLGAFDNSLDAWMQATFNTSTGLLLSGTIFALIFAYLVRFLAVAFGTIESSLGKITPNLDYASRSLGYGVTETLWYIHVPMMRGGLLTAGILVFVDVMKELPATLIIRPFNFDTLAIRTYQLASDERLAEAAGPALAIVLVGIIPVIFLSLRIRRSVS